MPATIPFVDSETTGPQTPMQTLPRREPAEQELVVVATSFDATGAAVRAACDVARPFKGRIRLLMPIVISFPAQLNDPPASYRHLVWAFQSMAGADVDRLQVSMWPCRDARAVLAANLPRRSTVIVGLKGFWDLRARRLARWLAVQGHRVLLAYPQARPSASR